MSRARLRAFAEVRLGRQRSPQNAEGPYMVRYLRAANVKAEALDLTDVKEMNFSPSEQEVFALKRGDVLVTEGAGSLAAVGASTAWNDELPGPVCIQNTLVRLRPRRAVADPRYLFWWAQHAHASGLFASVAGGVNIFHLGAERVGELPASVPSVTKQRAIAEFLDAETTQIDTLLSMRDRQADLLKERWIAVVSEMLWVGSTRRRQTRLKHLCGPPTSGNRDHSSFTYTADGIPCLRGLNVRRGWIERKELLRISARDHARHLQTELKSGDIVVVRSGLAGSAAVVPFDLDGSNCVDLVVVRRSDRVLPRYLELVLNSKETQEDVRRRSTGALLSHFNAVDAADVLVPTRSISEQQRVVAILDRAEDEIRRVAGMITGQIDLLRDRRQALITAAVTGEIDVSTASGRGVPA